MVTWSGFCGLLTIGGQDPLIYAWACWLLAAVVLWFVFWYWPTPAWGLGAVGDWAPTAVGVLAGIALVTLGVGIADSCRPA